MQSQHVTNAYNTTLSDVAAGTRHAVSQRDRVLGDVFKRSHTHTTITVAPTLTGSSAFQGDQKNGDLLLADGCDVSDKFRDLGEHGSDSSPGSNFGTGRTQLTLAIREAGARAEQRRSTSARRFCTDVSSCAGANTGRWRGVHGARDKFAEFAGGGSVGWNGPHSRWPALCKDGWRLSMASSIIGKSRMCGRPPGAAGNSGRGSRRRKISHD